MLYRNLGKSDIKVSVLGYGAGHIGDDKLSEKEIDILLNNIADQGVNFFDTARGYGMSEERMGKYLANRRDELIYSTKVGYGIENQTDWTYGCVKEGINNALRNLKTDYIDIVHLHSCDLEILKNGEVIEALLDAKTEGKLRLAAYSGENQDLDYAINLGLFDVIQTSINIFDQNGIDKYIKNAKQRSMGIIAKRPLANVPWIYDEQPFGNYCEEYWIRMKEMALKYAKDDYAEIALRFSAFTEGVSTCIAGTTNLDHLKENIRILGKGALDESEYNYIRKQFENKEKNWIGQV